MAPYADPDTRHLDMRGTDYKTALRYAQDANLEAMMKLAELGQQIVGLKNANMLLSAENKTLRRQLSEHQCGLPDSIKEALNSGDGTYRP